MASAGKGTPPHVAGELFKIMAGVDMLHVPYRGIAPALTDLLGGQVHVLFDPVPSSIGYVRSGKLRALGVTTAQRSESLADIPSIGETVVGYETGTWFGLAAPKATPPDIIEKLNATLNAVLADAAMIASLSNLGAGVFAGSPADFAGFLADETTKWADVVKRAGIRPE
jgi:tripartite-type tricarboxylate transporter receptor subunit TctC